MSTHPQPQGSRRTQTRRSRYTRPGPPVRVRRIQRTETPVSLIAPSDRLAALPRPAEVPVTARVTGRDVRRAAGQLVMALVDVALILVALMLAYRLRYDVMWPAPLNQIVREVTSPNYVPIRSYYPVLPVFVLLIMGVLFLKGLYRLPRRAGILDHASIIISSTTIAIALMIISLFLNRSVELYYSRLVYGFSWVTIIVVLSLWRAAYVSVVRWNWTRKINRERVLVIGSTGLGRVVMENIVAQPFLGYQLVGYVDDRDPPPTERPDGHFRYIGNIAEFPELVRIYQIDLVILALPFWENRRLPDLVTICRQLDVDFRIAPDLYELSFDRVDVGNVGTVPLIGLRALSLKGVNLVIKRAMDLLFTFLVSPLVLPLCGIIALLIRADSPGPVIFRQERIGKGGKPFTVYKFRTMVQDAESRKAELAAQNEADGPLFKMRDDPRRTRVGAVLRKYSLDELPQLWNIFCGEMSWVGPRPPTPDEVGSYQDWHLRRLEVTPGLTGLWQVLGRSDTSFDEMVRLDIYYAEHWTPQMDLRIMMQTVPVVLFAEGAY